MLNVIMVSSAATSKSNGRCCELQKCIYKSISNAKVGYSYAGNNNDASSIASVNSKGARVKGFASIIERGEPCDAFVNVERKRVK